MAGGIFWSKASAEKMRSKETLLKSIPRTGRPDGYVTSDQCQACHPAAYEAWHESFHRTMTQAASSESVVGDFSNVTLELLGKHGTLTEAAGAFTDLERELDRLHPVLAGFRAAGA